MKKLTFVILLIVFLFVLAGCESLKVDDSVLKKAGTATKESAQSVANWTDKQTNKTSTWVDNAKAKISDVVEKLEQKTEKIADTTEKYVSDKTEKVAEVADNTKNEVKNTTEDVVKEVSNAAKKGANTVADVLNNLGNKGNTIVEKAQADTQSAGSVSEKPSNENKKNIPADKPVVPVEEAEEPSNFAFVVIIVAILLIGVAISYYLISIKKRNND